jgi:hypothetical protein
MTRELELGDLIEEDGEVTPVYGYALKDFFIFDPRSSECGRFWVDPFETYGVTLEELRALDEANRKLRGSVPRLSPELPTTLQGILAEHTNLYIARTGGSCTALRLDRDDGSYVRLTGPDEARAPTEADTVIACEFYESEWDCEGICEEICVPQVAAWIDAALTRPLLTIEQRNQLQFQSILESRQLPETMSPREVLERIDNLPPEDIEFLTALSQMQALQEFDPGSGPAS